jgi:hypothetical protein
MPPKPPQPPPVAEVVEETPAAKAAREAQERQQAEDKKTFERNELVARRRVEAMEAISWRCVLCEREKRVSPDTYGLKTANDAPQQVWVKLVTGNRGIPQQTMRLPVAPEMTFGALKEAVQRHAVNASATKSIAQWFSPEYQVLHLYGKELGAEPDDEAPRAPTPSQQPKAGSAAAKEAAAREVAAKEAAAAREAAGPRDLSGLTLTSLGVHDGCTLHLMLRTPAPNRDTIPSMVR